MDWKAELDFELADATDTIDEIRQALPGAGAITPELAAAVERLAHRAGVLRGFVARLELLQASNFPVSSIHGT